LENIGRGRKTTSVFDRRKKKWGTYTSHERGGNFQRQSVSQSTWYGLRTKAGSCTCTLSHLAGGFAPKGRVEVMNCGYTWDIDY